MDKMMIGLIDSGICNLTSVVRAFETLGASVYIATRPQQLEGAVAIVLPGVGAFGDGMNGLAERGFIEPLRKVVARGTPLLGICLGMQLLLEESEEHGLHTGLSLLPGRVVRMRADKPGFRVPNIGWCDVIPTRAGKLFKDTAVHAYYFVHSYHVQTLPEYVAAEIEFSGRKVAVAIERGNVCGVQFHPEKSQDVGIDMLARWVDKLRASGRIKTTEEGIQL
jgi:glutamine amidotransferase